MCAQAAVQKKKENSFKKDEFVVYPVHGVGKIVAIEERVFDARTLEFLVIEIKEEKLVVRIPVDNLEKLGIRHLFDMETLGEIERILRQRVRVRRVMWSRRAQDYEIKINSGSPISIAEVIRELYKRNDAEQSYSERHIYQKAMTRLARELAAVRNISVDDAFAHLKGVLDAA